MQVSNGSHCPAVTIAATSHCSPSAEKSRLLALRATTRPSPCNLARPPRPVRGCKTNARGTGVRAADEAEVQGLRGRPHARASSHGLLALWRLAPRGRRRADGLHQALRQLGQGPTSRSARRLRAHDARPGHLRPRRRLSWRRELSSAEPPETAIVTPSSVEDRLLLFDALAKMPPRQRAVVVPALLGRPRRHRNRALARLH